MWCAVTHPRFYLQIEVSVMKLTYFLGLNTVSHDSGPCLRRNVMSLMTSSASSTRQEWYVRVNLHIRHRLFVSEKPNGKWRIVHDYNNLNAATIPAQTLIHRKDVLQNNMVDCTTYSALDLVDGYYQLLMQASNIRLQQ